MRGFRIRAVPGTVIEDDEQRFSNSTVMTVVQYSGLPVVDDVMRRFCWWFVGRSYGWKTYDGNDWAEGFGAEWALALGQHLGLKTDRRARRLTLHMGPKAGTHNGQQFHWTRFLAIDIDARSGQPTGSIRDRYDGCLRAFGTTPLVLRSPRHGLHLYFPLATPVSILGLTQTFKPGASILAPRALELEGLRVASGWVEVRPVTTRTLRVPLGSGTVQLDPATLLPLPTVARPDEIDRLVATMDHLASTSPLDVLALAQRHEGTPRSPTTRERSAVLAIPIPASRSLDADAGKIDVDRLERDGLYVGLSRNEAAMALARRKMLVEGWDEAATVEFLMNWTACMTNGLSQQATMIARPAVVKELRDEYHRICRRINHALSTGEVVARIGRPVGRPITADEARWVFRAADEITDPTERYRVEVFLFCALGFGKDLGQQVHGPARYQNAVVVHSQLPSKVMERWPYCGSGAYRRRLRWAESVGFTRLVLNYRRSDNPSLCRAKTFELEVDPDGLSGIDADAAALAAVCAEEVRPGCPRVHPRQIEHALYALGEYGDGTDDRYGSEAKTARRLAAAYQDAIEVRRDRDGVDAA